MIAQRHMHVHGTTKEQLAHVAVQTRAHALLHPNAHMKKAITLEQVLQAKPIADPLGMLDCCLISDAGGAFIVTSAPRPPARASCSPPTAAASSPGTAQASRCCGGRPTRAWC